MERTMKISVQCYAGHRADERPLSFTVGERSIEVIALIDRWYEPAASYFKVRGNDGHTYILRHDEISDEWGMSFFRARG